MKSAEAARVKPAPNASTKGYWHRWFAQGARFFQLPEEIVTDDRLTYVDKAVLIAIASFAYDVDFAFPSRNAISKRCGVTPSNVSHCTRRLEALGWLTKQHLFNKPVHYYLHIPKELLAVRNRTASASEAKLEVATERPASATAEIAGTICRPLPKLRPEDQIDLDLNANCDEEAYLTGNASDTDAFEGGDNY